jgi:hypothetical protein
MRRAAKALVKAGHVMLKILNISEYLTFQTGGAGPAGRFDFIKHGRAKARQKLFRLKLYEDKLFN